MVAAVVVPVDFGTLRHGRRRARVEECAYTLRAEDVYSRYLADGATGDCVDLVFGDVTVRVLFDVRPNAVWRHGRVFLRCPGCGRRCTRVYRSASMPVVRCRRCLGLVYGSQVRNYRDRPIRNAFAALLGLTMRDRALEHGRFVAAERREASERRWADRRGVRVGG